MNWNKPIASLGLWNSVCWALRLVLFPFIVNSVCQDARIPCWDVQQSNLVAWALLLIYSFVGCVIHPFINYLLCPLLRARQRPQAELMWGGQRGAPSAEGITLQRPWVQKNADGQNDGTVLWSSTFSLCKHGRCHPSDPQFPHLWNRDSSPYFEDCCVIS